MEEQKEHTDYINGQLTPEEVKELWRIFLKKPDRFARFLIQVEFEYLIRSSIY